MVAALLVILTGLTLYNFAVSAFFFWLACRICRARIRQQKQATETPNASETGPAAAGAASIGARNRHGPVSHISLWRDMYHTQDPGRAGAGLGVDWRRTSTWGP